MDGVAASGVVWLVDAAVSVHCSHQGLHFSANAVMYCVFVYTHSLHTVLSSHKWKANDQVVGSKNTTYAFDFTEAFFYT